MTQPQPSTTSRRLLLALPVALALHAPLGLGLRLLMRRLEAERTRLPPIKVRIIGADETVKIHEDG